MISKQALIDLILGEETDFEDESKNDISGKVMDIVTILGDEISESLISERTEGHNAMVWDAMSKRTIVDYPVMNSGREDVPDSAMTIDSKSRKAKGAQAYVDNQSRVNNDDYDDTGDMDSVRGSKKAKKISEGNAVNKAAKRKYETETGERITGSVYGAGPAGLDAHTRIGRAALNKYSLRRKLSADVNRHRFFAQEEEQHHTDYGMPKWRVVYKSKNKFMPPRKNNAVTKPDIEFHVHGNDEKTARRMAHAKLSATRNGHVIGQWKANDADDYDLHSITKVE